MNAWVCGIKLGANGRQYQAKNYDNAYLLACVRGDGLQPGMRICEKSCGKRTNTLLVWYNPMYGFVNCATSPIPHYSDKTRPALAPRCRNFCCSASKATLRRNHCIEGKIILYSMTGFGRGENADAQQEVQVEIKSVNHRYLDISVRLPRTLNYLEDKLRKQLGTVFARGHLDVYVTLAQSADAPRSAALDSGLLAAYVTALREAGEKLCLPDDLTLSVAAGLSGVLAVEPPRPDEDALTALVLRTLEQAAGKLKAMRAAEGAQLKRDMLSRIEGLGALLQKVREKAPDANEQIRQRLTERVTTAFANNGAALDEGRLLTEVALLAERSDISEEVVRLASHLEQFCLHCDANHPVGRKLDFLVQEMNREVNTIGSKAGDLTITNLVVDMKSEIEKVREQLQNVE